MRWGWSILAVGASYGPKASAVDPQLPPWVAAEKVLRSERLLLACMQRETETASRGTLAAPWPARSCTSRIPNTPRARCEQVTPDVVTALCVVTVELPQDVAAFKEAAASAAKAGDCLLLLCCRLLYDEPAPGYVVAVSPSAPAVQAVITTAWL